MSKSALTGKYGTDLEWCWENCEKTKKTPIEEILRKVRDSGNESAEFKVSINRPESKFVSHLPGNGILDLIATEQVLLWLWMERRYAKFQITLNRPDVSSIVLYLSIRTVYLLWLDTALI